MGRYKNMKRILKISLSVVLVGLIYLPSQLHATGQIRAGSLTAVPACGVPGESITITVDLQANTWQTISYGMAFSADNAATADPTDSWVLGGGAGICPQAGVGLAQTGVAGWHTVVQVVTIPAGFAGGYLIVVVGENGMPYSTGACNPHQQMAIAIDPFCGPPSPTVTPTSTISPTPVLPLVKSSNVSVAAVGDTITFCIAWTNDSNQFLTRTFYDDLVTELTYVGGDAGCSVSGQLVTCSFPAAAGASGSQCFWAVVNSAP